MNIQRTSFALATLVILAYAGTPARADDPAPGAPMPPPPMQPGSGAPAAPAAPVPATGRFFDTYDANQDGKVTKQEFTGDAEVFDLLDKDKDGVVTTVELGLPVDYKPVPLLPKQDENPGMKGGGNQAKRLEEFKQRLLSWDTDKDGKVTREEYKGKASFDFMDRNKDGVLTIEDLGRGGKGGAPDPAEVMNRFKEADKNADGKVTAEEWPGPPERFKQLDKNGDGALTADEIEAAMKGGAGKGDKPMGMAFDKNGDGKVSRDEFPGGDEAFKLADKNGDGALTPDEVAALPRGKKPGKAAPGTPEPGQGGAMPPPSPGAGEGGGEMGGGTPAAGGGGIGSLFTALDKDHDGKLTRAEFPGTDDEWRRIDKDANGWITPEEAK